MSWERLTGTPRARFYCACAVGGFLAMVVLAWFLLVGQANFFRGEFLSNFYDVQARSLLHGHWDVPANSLAFERFKIAGKYYTYEGPWPAILRMPVILFTHRFDGHLSRISMLLAFAILTVFVARLSWRARTRLRGDGMPTRAALWAAGGFMFLSTCGSIVIFLASRSWSYHEAILWALSWSVAAYTYLLDYLAHPTRRSISLAGLTATLAFLSRGTVGAGPVAALGLVLAARVARWGLDAWRARHDADGETAPPAWLRWLGLGSDPEHRSIRPLALATAVPLVLYAYVNDAKFGTFFGAPPYTAQDRLVSAPQLKATLAAYHGGLFSLRAGPTNLLQYFRPDAITFNRLFPWVGFSKPARVIAGASFVSIDKSVSIPAASTLLFLLAILGVIATVRAPRPADGGPTAASLRVPLLGAAIGGVGALFVAYQEERYQADIYPFLVLAAAAGLWFLPRLLAGIRVRATRLAVGAAVVVLAVWSCWASAGLTLLYQRAFSPFVDEHTLARFVNFQLAVYQRLPGGAPGVGHGATLPLPPPGPQQSLFEVGDCAGLYWSDGRNWLPIEETPATGRFELRVRFATAPPGTLEPLLSAHDPRGTSIVWARALTGHRVTFEYQYTGTPSTRASGGTLRVAPGRVADLGFRLDPVFGYFEVRRGATILLSAFAPVAQSGVVVGHQTGSTRGTAAFAGTIESGSTPTPVCDRLRRLGA